MSLFNGSLSIPATESEKSERPVKTPPPGRLHLTPREYLLRFRRPSARAFYSTYFRSFLFRFVSSFPKPACGTIETFHCSTFDTTAMDPNSSPSPSCGATARVDSQASLERARETSRPWRSCPLPGSGPAGGWLSGRSHSSKWWWVAIIAPCRGGRPNSSERMSQPSCKAWTSSPAKRHQRTAVRRTRGGGQAHHLGRQRAGGAELPEAFWRDTQAPTTHNTPHVVYRDRRGGQRKQTGTLGPE